MTAEEEKDPAIFLEEMGVEGCAMVDIHDSHAPVEEMKGGAYYVEDLLKAYHQARLDSLLEKVRAVEANGPEADFDDAKIMIESLIESELNEDSK